MGKPIEPMQLIVPIQFSSYAYSRASEATYYGSDGLLNTAAVDQLRLGYDPSDLSYIGAIIEGSATNLMTYSKDVSHGEWSAPSVGFLYDSLVANPDGTTGAHGIDGTGPINRTITPGNYTYSVFVKLKSGSPSNNFRISGSVNSAEWNLVTGALVSGANPYAFIQKLPNGWWRVAVSGTFGSVVQMTTAAGQTAQFWLWGCQLEAETSSAIPTSFIATIGSAATRAADIAGDPPLMLSTNIPETDYPEWDAGATYAVNDMVMISANHRNWKALASSTGVTPGSDPTKWLDAGATNAWRMFDMQVGADLQSFHGDTIETTVSLNEIVTSVCLFNIQGTSATVRMLSEFGELVYEKTIDLPALIASPSWYEFYFGKRQQIKSAMFLDLPPYSVSTITIIVTNEGDEARLGKAVIGRAVNLGFTEYQSSAGIVSYSVKETDSFGNSKIVPRRFVGSMDLKVVLNRGGEDFAVDQLSAARDISSVYIGHKDYQCLIVLGFFNDFRVLFSTAASSYCNMTVTGI